MASDPQWVIAFAGSGDSTLDNTRDALNNWITDDTDVKTFIVPAKISKRSQKGLANVVSYLTEDWEDFDTAPEGDIIDLLTDARTNGREPYLVVIVGDGVEADDVTADLIERALEEEIPVKDLAAGLDDYDPPEPEITEPVAPAPEEPAAATTRRKRTTTTPPADETAETVSATRPKRRGTPRAAEPEAPAKDEPLPWEPDAVTDAGKIVDEVLEVKAPVPASSTDDVRRMIREEVRSALADVLTGGLNMLGVQIVPVDAPKTAYIKSEDGTLRKRGRGKPGTGQEVVFLTDQEVAAKEEKGLISK
jgi:hypothetical protein